MEYLNIEYRLKNGEAHLRAVTYPDHILVLTDDEVATLHELMNGDGQGWNDFT